MMDRSRKERYGSAQPTHDGALWRVQLTANLSQGGSATAKRLDPTGSGGALAVSTAVITVYDPFSFGPALNNTKMWVIYSADDQKWSPLAPVPHLIGVLDGPMSVDSSATVSIYGGSGRPEPDSTLNVTAYDWLLNSGTTLPAGSVVWLGWADGRWYVTQANCID